MCTPNRVYAKQVYVSSDLWKYSNPENPLRLCTLYSHRSFISTCYRILGSLPVGKSDISDGSNSTISFARSFTHRRRKTRCILLLRLPEFISTMQVVYQFTRVSIELRKALLREITPFLDDSFLETLLPRVTASLSPNLHESIATGLYSNSWTRDPAWYLRPGISYLIVYKYLNDSSSYRCMPTHINLTLSRLDFMSPFYRLLIIPSNLTLSFHVVVFQSMSNLLVTSK